MGKPKGDVDGLIQALEDDDVFVRVRAARALGKIGDARAVEPLTRALKDKEFIVQIAVEGALAKIKGKKG